MTKAFFVSLAVTLMLTACEKQPETKTSIDSQDLTPSHDNARAAMKYKDPREGVHFKSFSGGTADLQNNNKEASQ